MTSKIHHRAQTFCRLRSSRELAMILEIPEYVLELQAELPGYEIFYIRKRNGGRRLIENPMPQLKKIQRKLNRYLQAVYEAHRSEAAYGFMIRSRNREARNIVTNARRHLSRPYLMNVDFKHFFHSIDGSKVLEVFCSVPFEFPEALAQQLRRLCCHQGRLPMGAPTSPVLSNLYCLPLDKALHQMALAQQLVFTRYADDMSFSAKEPLPASLLQSVRQIAAAYGLLLNEEKTRYFDHLEDKVITGILVSDRLALPPQLLRETKEEIKKLRHIIGVAQRYHRPKPSWVREHQQRIAGYLQYAKQVLGAKDEQVQALRMAYHQALYPPQSDDPMSWSALPYF